MTSDPLVQQFLVRQEEALAEAKRRYGSALRSLSLRILGSPEDAEEVENETYLEAWNQIPPAEPDSLKSYLYMICRRRSLDRLDERLAKKRGGGEAAAGWEELEDILPGEFQMSREFSARRDAMREIIKSIWSLQRVSKLGKRSFIL